MKTVPFHEIKNELISNFRRQMLIPIIGSGFTKDCTAYNGRVPSGEDYRLYMVGKIQETLQLPDAEKAKLQSESFSNVSAYYHDVVPSAEQKTYLKNNFTRVRIEDEKKDFLSLPWPYVYTLNIDDGIENGSEYKQVVCANREIDHSVFDDENCVIKLHGDIHEMLTYADSQSEVFTQLQYVASLKKNASLLTKLTHDGIYQNLLFVGCSLDDEIDLLASLMNNGSSESVTAKYICLTEQPSVLDALKYERYGITHCILFDSFESIYADLYAAGVEAEQISCDDLENYKSFSIETLSSDYEQNKPYLLFGKSLINKNHTITLPYFFISREESEKIIANLSRYNLQLLIGNRCSGKSYLLADVACKIRDKDVFYFETKDRLSDRAFNQLLNKQNCVILADCTAFSTGQFEMILESFELLKRNRVNIVIVVNKNDRDFNAVLKLQEMRGKIDVSSIAKTEIDNRFTASELARLNPLLTAIDAGIFSEKKTIVDNIIEVSENLSEKNKYHQVTPRFNSIRELAALIALGIERKIYSNRATKLDFHVELELQQKATEPLIDCESTWSFEKDRDDNSPVKYVANAEYWLCGQLERFAENPEHHKLIVDAFRYIIEQIIAQEGVPDLLYGAKNISCREYILFDNINRIFFPYKRSGYNGIQLIRVIYEGLNDRLSVDPNYMHQRSKCYIKSSYYAKETEEKLAFLDRAYRDANVAHQVFSHRFDECGNEKLLISIAHITYTQALILCHKCSIHNYEDVAENTAAIELLHAALSSPYNSYEFAKTDSFNYRDVIGTTVTTAIADQSLVLPEALDWLEELYYQLSNA